MLVKIFLIFSILITSFTAQAQGIENTWTDYIGLYQRLGSQQVGGNCRMTPSCSNYGMLQFKSHSPLVALMNTSDRLLRCSHDLANYSITMTKDSYRLIDFPTMEANRLARPQWSEINYAAADSLELLHHSMSFIAYLMNQEQYAEALLEINRSIYAHKQQVLPLDLYVNYLRCLRSLGSHEKIHLVHQTIIPVVYREESEVLIEIARTWLALENYPQTLRVIQQIKSRKENPQKFKDEASILASICYAREFKWTDAQQVLVSIEPRSIYFLNAQDNQKQVSLGLAFKPKKPWIAGVLGIIPGAGYLYSNHPSSAFSSFVFNGLLAFAAYSSFQSGNTGIGVLSSIIGFGFYAGNIQGSVKSVKRYNQINQEKISNPLNLSFSF
jgi:putative component of membrane protein insertase Oxa1/YidC/SpoIIIJ protein YidD